MGARRPGQLARVDDLFRSLTVRAGKGLLAQELSKRRLTKEATRVANHMDRKLSIILGGEEVCMDRWRSGRVG